MTDFEKWWIEQGEDLLEIGNIYEIAMAAWSAATAALRAEIDTLRRDEKERAEEDKDYAHFRRRQDLQKCKRRKERLIKKNNQLRAEIKRKDEVLELVLDVLLNHRDDPDLIEWAESKVYRVISTEEASDGK